MNSSYLTGLSVSTKPGAIHGLPRRPEDYTRARAELHGAFVRPTASDSIEFINPSVVDWLNRVVRQEPENVVDLIRGAVRFTQVVQIWNFIQSAVGGGCRKALRQNISQLAPTIGKLAMAERASPHEGGVSYLAPSYEERLATLIRMADMLRVSALFPAIEGVITRIEGEHSKTHCDIEKTIAAVRAYEQAEWEGLERFESFFQGCADELIASAGHSCGSIELRELLEQYKVSATPNHPLQIALRKTLEGFVGNYLSDEISGCQSGQDFDCLIDNLEYFRPDLGC